MALPPGRLIDIPDRGQTFIREVQGPDNAPTLILLHGWTATADLNFFMCYRALSEHFRVIAIDHRGHGRGIRSNQPFRLSDCADDDIIMISDLDEIPNLTSINFLDYKEKVIIFEQRLFFYKP